MTNRDETDVLAGVSSLPAWLGQRYHGRTALIVVDRAVAGSAVENEVMRRVASAEITPEKCVPPRGADLTSICRLAERASSSALVVGVGGGDVMDQAKLGSALADDETVHHRLVARQRCGLIALPRTLRRKRGLVLIPTTMGTGAQVSPNACLHVEGAKRIVNGRCLRPDAAVVDSIATDGLPAWLITEAVLENFARISGFYVGHDLDVPAADALVEDLVRDIVRVAYRVRDARRAGVEVPAQVRAEVSWISGRTHSPDLVAGRVLYIDKSWPLANELSTTLGIRKVDAMALLLVPLWRRIVDGESSIGSARRLHRLWSVVRSEAPERVPADPVVGLAEFLDSRSSDRASIVDTVIRGRQRAADLVDIGTARAERAWGGALPMLRGMSRDQIGTLYAEALAPPSAFESATVG